MINKCENHLKAKLVSEQNFKIEFFQLFKSEDNRHLAMTKYLDRVFRLRVPIHFTRPPSQHPAHQASRSVARFPMPSQFQSFRTICPPRATPESRHRCQRVWWLLLPFTCRYRFQARISTVSALQPGGAKLTRPHLHLVLAIWWLN